MINVTFMIIIIIVVLLLSLLSFLSFIVCKGIWIGLHFKSVAVVSECVSFPTPQHGRSLISHFSHVSALDFTVLILVLWLCNLEMEILHFTMYFVTPVDFLNISRYCSALGGHDFSPKCFFWKVVMEFSLGRESGKSLWYIYARFKYTISTVRTYRATQCQWTGWTRPVYV